MNFECTPVALDFIENAPLLIENTVEVNATPEQVFNILADVDSWPEWFSGMTHVEWLTDEPYGVGSQRQISLLGLIKVSETFLVWEPGKRFTFRFESQNALLARAAIEDIQLQAVGEDRCRVIYRVHMELPRPLSPLGRILKPVLGGIFKRGAQGLKRYIG